MNVSDMLVVSAVRNWNTTVERASRFFGGLTEEQLLIQVAPNRNRLIYLWGHLVAVHDAMLPLLALGARQYTEYDPLFVSAPDRSQLITLSKPDLELSWKNVSRSLSDGFGQLTSEDWAQKHSAVSEDDFAREPHRNRFAILVGRSSHLSYHLGQAALAAK